METLNFLELKMLLIENKYKILKEKLLLYRAPDIAQFIEQYLDFDSNLIIFFNLIPEELSADVFSELAIDTQKFIISELSNEKLSELIAGLETDDRATLLEELSDKTVEKLINLLPKEEQIDTLKTLSYPEGTIGRIMTTDFIAIKENWSIEKSLNYIRNKSVDIDNVDIIYVTDNNNKLLDFLELSEFVYSEPSVIVKDILDYSVAKLLPDDSTKKGVEMINKYNLVSIPVVDDNDRLIGIVTFDDIMDIEQQEISKTFYKKSAISPLHYNYIESNIFDIYLKRIPWLFLLVLVNLLSGSIISAFESTLEKAISLVFFLPLLIASAGNAGSQSSTLIIRAMATGDISNKDFIIVIFKDLLVSILLGLVMGISVFILGYFRSGLTIAITVSLSMFFIVLFGSFIGSILPFIFSFFKIDPANGSSPLVTTLADIFGVFLYFYIATIILKIN